MIGTRTLATMGAFGVSRVVSSAAIRIADEFETH
jgi:hypothetical protein